MTCVSRPIVVAFAEDRCSRTCLRLARPRSRASTGETELIVVLNDAPGGVRCASCGRRRSRTDRTAARGSGSPEVTAAVAAAHGEWIALVNDDCLLEPRRTRRAPRRRRPATATSARSPRRSGSPTAGHDQLGRPRGRRTGVARERLLGAAAARGRLRAGRGLRRRRHLGLYRRAMLDSVGGIDDLVLRLSRGCRPRVAGQDAGLALHCYAPRAVALHQHSATLGHGSSCKYWLVGRNRVRMLAKNATGRAAASPTRPDRALRPALRRRGPSRADGRPRP